MADRPHFAFPFVRSNGKVNVVEQDTEDHDMARANVVVRFDLGSRPGRPDFGWPHPTFRQVPLDLTELEDALARAGIEADAHELEVMVDQTEREVTVEVR
jgi:hypothetical protein